MQENVAKAGLGALNLTLDFDELAILQENSVYLANTLELEGIDIQPAVDADEKTREECCPGNPFIQYRIEVTW